MPRDLIPADWNWKAPDYAPVLYERARRLAFLRAHPELLPALKAKYKADPISFIEDWGTTYDPRLVGKPGRIPRMPFLLFDQQREFLRWAIESWQLGEDGAAEKSRDVGLSWLALALSCTLCIFNDDMTIGFGSRKEEYVDKAGFPRALFFKGRMFMDGLPREFRGGWSRKTDAHMRMSFSETGSTMTGEAGDNIGRGDRTGLHWTDEDAYIDRPELVDAALSQATSCRLRISSAHGTENTFYQRREAWKGTRRLFTFHWRSDPRKDDAWYAAEVAEIDNPVIVAQELDLNYTASVEGVLIPNEWVQACIDSHLKLGFNPTGEKFAALDIADRGDDKNALIGGYGVLLERAEQWSGKNSDIMYTTQHAFMLCDEMGYRKLRYDADGLGVGLRGDARTINEQRTKTDARTVISIEAWQGSSTDLFEPKSKVGGKASDRTNEDFFANCKAQGWWGLRTRAMKTFRMVHDLTDESGAKFNYPVDDLLSISSKLPPATLSQLTTELSQPTFTINGAGKLVVDKQPDGVKSPNYGDGTMMRFALMRRSMTISDEVLRMSAGGRR